LHRAEQALRRERLRAARLRIEDHLHEAREWRRALPNALLRRSDGDQAGDGGAGAAERAAHRSHGIERRSHRAVGERGVEHYERLVGDFAEQAPQPRQVEGRELGTVEQ
jgi:hypothetical protein